MNHSFAKQIFRTSRVLSLICVNA